MYDLEQVEQMRAQADGVTMLHPVAAGALAITVFLILSLPRKKALVPFIAMTMLIPYYQRISISSLDFFLCRLLIIVGWIRIVIRSELIFGNKIDKIFGSMVIMHAIAAILIWQSDKGIITGSAYTLDMLGSYILLRSLIREFDDIDRIIKAFAIITIIIAVNMLNEQINHKNIFSLFGGVPEDTFFRNGRYRSQGSFGHPILAGCFGAVMLPLFVYLYAQQKVSKLLTVASIVSALIVVFTAASSGPVFAAMAAISALLLYPFRRFMRTIRWGVLSAIITLHFFMKAPVWALIGRVSVFGGSTSYHRYTLVDQFIRRINEWWLMGTKSTAHWSEFLSTWDVANQYVRIGVDGGLITLILFIVLISICFIRIGRGMKSFEHDSNKLFLLWTVGAMLFTHLVAFMGVSYFAQSYLLLILTLVVISTLNDLSKKSSAQNAVNMTYV